MFRMNGIRQIINIIIIAALIFLFFSGCVKPSEKKINFAKGQISFRDIPGVTADEINAVEAVRRQKDFFIYGSIREIFKIS